MLTEMFWNFFTDETVILMGIITNLMFVFLFGLVKFLNILFSKIEKN